MLQQPQAGPDRRLQVCSEQTFQFALFFSNDLYGFSTVPMENDSKSWIFKKKKKS